MSQPPVYNRSASFSNDQAANPTSPLSGSKLDIELNNVKTTLDAIEANLKLIQRDDGAVANASIGLAQLSSAVTVGFSVPTAWVTGHGYVSSPASTVFNGGKFYSCLISHTSGTFATDLAALRWVLIADLTAIPLVAANQIAVTASGNLTTDVQGSLQALDAAKAATSHTHVSSAISDSTSDGRAFLTATLASQKTLLGLGSLAFLNTVAVTAITANLAFTGKISPGALAGTTNDWSPTGWATAAIVDVSTTGAQTITGLAATSDGDIKVLTNVGTSAITFTRLDTGSAAANRVALTRPVVLSPNQSIALKYDGTFSLWFPVALPQEGPVAAGFKNLICGNVAGPNGFTAPTTAGNQYKLTADALTLEDANGTSWRVTSVSVTGDITSSGANGLDTSTVGASTVYFFWVIGNPTTNTVAALWSTSATAPTMPSGYTFKARYSWGRTTGASVFQRVLQQGKDAQYVVSAAVTTSLPTIQSGTAGSTFNSTTFTPATVSLSALLPATASRIRFVLGCGGSSGNVALAPNSLYAGYDAANSVPAFVTGAHTSQCMEFALEGTSVFYGSDIASGKAQILGWTDNI